MNELDQVLDMVMKSIEAKLPEENRAELIGALREKKRKQIIDEIRSQYKDELMKEAETELQKENNRQKIKELKELLWSGFVLAFIVGLAVNQVTDMIGYWKGTVTLESIWPTVVITGCLCVACLAAYFYSFVKNALALINDFSSEKPKE